MLLTIFTPSLIPAAAYAIASAIINISLFCCNSSSTSSFMEFAFSFADSTCAICCLNTVFAYSFNFNSASSLYRSTLFVSSAIFDSNLTFIFSILRNNLFSFIKKSFADSLSNRSASSCLLAFLYGLPSISALICS